MRSRPATSRSMSGSPKRKCHTGFVCRERADGRLRVLAGSLRYRFGEPPYRERTAAVTAAAGD